MSKYILDLIEQGEHQTLDFKYQVNDAKKIARSVSAFANTDGGRLLIGVKDNGKVAGIRSEEEYYMMETAASVYCKPEVWIEANPYVINGKQVLEVVIPAVNEGPVFAPDPDGKWQAYARYNDMNLVADDILRTVWKMESNDCGAYIKYSKEEKQILKIVEENPGVGLDGIRNNCKIKYSVLRKVLINFVVTQILILELTEHGSVFRLAEDIILEDS